MRRISQCRTDHSVTDYGVAIILYWQFSHHAQSAPHMYIHTSLNFNYKRTVPVSAIIYLNTLSRILFAHVLLEFRLTSLTLSLIQSETSIVASVNRNRRKQSNGKLMLRYHYTILCGYFNSYCWHDIPPFSLYRGAVMGIKHLHKECQTNQTQLST